MACECADERMLGDTKYTYVGPTQGAYEQVTELKYVGEGQGSINKEQQITVKKGVPWAWCVLLLPLLVLPFLPFWFFRHQASAPVTPVPVPRQTTPQEVIVRHHFLTRTHDVHVPVPVPGPDHVVYDKVYAPHAHFSCANAELSDSSETYWSAKHKAWCCWKFSIGCPSHVVTQDKFIHVQKTHAVPVPHYYNVPIPSPPSKPIYEKTYIPTAPLPPKHVPVPVKIPAKIPDPIVHYKYKAVPQPYKVPHVVYDKQEVPVHVTVKKYVKDYVPQPPEIIHRTHTEYVPEQSYDCDEGFEHWEDVWSVGQRRFCCWKANRGCAQTHYKTKTQVKTHIKYVKVPVPSPPKIIVRHHEVHPHLQSFDCTQGFSNWFHGWSPLKKKYCCAHENRGCPGAAHGHMSVTVHTVHMAGAGKATGKIYDCNAGFDNWLQGWSDSKKTWCCDKEQRGCVKHHCYSGEISTWNQDKRDWCCSNYQRGCAHTTLSPLGCDAVCTLHGESSTCKDRMAWVQEHVFGSQDNSCNLAYSKVQVDCSVCRACSIGAAGCEIIQGTAKAAFDCNAALNNFFRAWSPPKKQWCCSKEGKGCEGNSPPSVDPGFGMKWKHVQVNGFWTWMAIHVSGAGGTVAVPPKLPYDCHAGLANWKLGWSDAKKGWCCSNQKMGCPGSAGGMGAGGAAGAAGGSYTVHTSWSTHGFPPSAAAHGMEWHWAGNHWSQIHMAGHAAFHCHGAVAAMPEAQKKWCCLNEGLGCQ